MQLRTAKPEDDGAIDALICIAFAGTDHGYDGEAELVTALQQDATFNPELAVVAIQDEQVIGYGLLTEVTVASQVGLCLAPLAVAPKHQKQGVGGQLIAALEQRAVAAGYGFISILGWPAYYTRFGYVPASQYDVQAPMLVPDEAFMIKAVTPGGLTGVRGTLQYLPAFGI